MLLCIAAPKCFNDGSPSKNSTKEAVAVAGYASAIQNLEGLLPLLS